MFDPQRLLGQLVGDALLGEFGERRRGRDLGMSAATKAQLGLGALGLAIAAFEHFRDRGQQATSPNTSSPPPPPPAPVASTPASAVVPPPPPPTAFDPLQLPSNQADAVLLIRAMIAAAAADGIIDARERQRILDRAVNSGIDPETFAFLEAELAAPKRADEIGAMTPPGLTEDVFAAAVLAIDLDSDSERQFLQRLGDALGLSAEDRDAIVRRLGAG